MLVKRVRENKIVNYSTFNKKGNEDINDFITKLEKVFVINRIVNNKKHIVMISYLKGIVANFYNRLNGIIN